LVNPLVSTRQPPKMDSSSLNYLIRHTSTIYSDISRFCTAVQIFTFGCDS
jgi:hypothetical protein